MNKRHSYAHHLKRALFSVLLRARDRQNERKNQVSFHILRQPGVAKPVPCQSGGNKALRVCVPSILTAGTARGAESSDSQWGWGATGTAQLRVLTQPRGPHPST